MHRNGTRYGRTGCNRVLASIGSTSAPSRGLGLDLVINLNADYLRRINALFMCSVRSFDSIHNVVDCGVLRAMWEELAGHVVHRDQLIICC